MYFGSSVKPSNLLNFNLVELERHIWHQLKERTKFVKPQNYIVGNIYFDLGNILAQTTDVQAALESYEAAKEYGFRSELMDLRIAEFEILANNAERHGNFIDFIKNHIVAIFFTSFALFLLFLILIIRWYYKRKRKKFSTQ